MRPSPARLRPRRHASVAGVAALVAATALGALGATAALDGGGLGAPAPDAPATTATPLAVLELETPLSRVIAVLGQPVEQGIDLGGTAHRFAVAGGEVWVTAADEPERPLLGWMVKVEPGAELTVPAGGGTVRLGHDTTADLLAAWGQPAGVATAALEHETLSYLGCDGGWPVVTKLGQAGGGAPAPDATLVWLLHGYADGEPGGPACLAGTDAAPVVA